MPILPKVKDKVAQVLLVDVDKISFDKESSHHNYIYLEVDDKHEVRVEMDLLMDNWWMEEKIDGVWKRTNILKM